MYLKPAIRVPDIVQSVLVLAVGDALLVRVVVLVDVFGTELHVVCWIVRKKDLRRSILKYN